MDKPNDKPKKNTSEVVGVIVVVVIIGVIVVASIVNVVRLDQRVYCSSGAEVTFKDSAYNEKGGVRGRIINDGVIPGLVYSTKDNVYVFDKKDLVDYGSGCREFGDLSFGEKWNRFMEAIGFGRNDRR